MAKVIDYIACAAVFLFALSLYSSKSLLDGNFVYDDAGSVTGNGIVQMTLPLSDLWHLDYWGTPLSDFSSHKSWRPLTTWTFYMNNKIWGNHPYSFHLTNACIHAFTSMLVVPTVLLAVPQSTTWFAFITGMLFSSHPVHVESVQNINGRADVLGSLFYLLGFVIYAKLVSIQAYRASRQIVIDDDSFGITLFKSIFVYTLPVMCCTCLGMLSKETSITLPVLCSLWDFAIPSKLSVMTFIKQKNNNKAHDQSSATYQIKWFHNVFTKKNKKIRIVFIKWLLRTLLLAFFTISLALFRSNKNGNKATPKLTLNQNRISLQECGDNCFMHAWQLLSIFYLWYEYLKTMVFPISLSADWSGRNFPPLYESENITLLYQRNFQDTPNEYQANNFMAMDERGSLIFSTSSRHGRTSHTINNSGDYLTSAQLQYEGFRYGKGINDERLPITLLFVWCCFAFSIQTLKATGVINYLICQPTSHNTKEDEEDENEEEGDAQERYKTNDVVTNEEVNDKRDIRQSMERKDSLRLCGNRNPVPFVSFLFLFVPFVMSSNLCVAIGTTKAERLMYLPVLGYCIIISAVLSQNDSDDEEDGVNHTVKIDNPQSSRFLRRRKDKGNSVKSSFLVILKKIVCVLTIVGYSRRTLQRAQEWGSTLALWESAYLTGTSLGYVTAHTLQNYALALQWEGEYEAANLIFEEFDQLGNEDLEDLKFNVEIYHVLGLRIIGKLSQAKTMTQSALKRLDQMIAHKESEGKDASGQKQKKGKMLRLLALVISHESLAGAAKILQGASGSTDHFTLRCIDEMNNAFKELETLNQVLLDRNLLTQPLTAMPYPFRGYDELAGNRPLLSSSSEIATKFTAVRDGGNGHVALMGGGSGGSLRNLFS